jgi:hypothetical protein
LDIWHKLKHWQVFPNALWPKAPTFHYELCWSDYLIFTCSDTPWRPIVGSQQQAWCSAQAIPRGSFQLPLFHSLFSTLRLFRWISTASRDVVRQVMANEMKRFVGWKLRQQRWIHASALCCMPSKITCFFPFAEIRCSLWTNPSLKVSDHFLACCLAYGHSNSILNSFLHQNIL